MAESSGSSCRCRCYRQRHPWRCESCARCGTSRLWRKRSWRPARATCLEDPTTTAKLPLQAILRPRRSVRDIWSPAYLW
jgi:hypothetical protein